MDPNMSRESFAQECERMMRAPRDERHAALVLQTPPRRRQVVAPEMRADGQRGICTRTGIVIGGAHTRRPAVDAAHAMQGPYRTPGRRAVRWLLGAALLGAVALTLSHPLWQTLQRALELLA